MKTKFLLSAFAMMAMGSSSIMAADFYVALNGDDSNPGTQSQPFATPEAAMLAAAYLSGSEACNIYLQDDATFMVGTLRIEDNLTVNLIGNNSTLKAADVSGREDESAPGQRILRIGSNTQVEISGVNFVNGRQTDYFPGGAIFTLGNSLVVDNCSFIDNEAGSSGGAIASRGHYVEVTNSYFQGNFTRGGGATGAAISMVGNANAENFGELYVENCAFVGNEAFVDGGHSTVISIYDPCLDVQYALTGKVSIVNCTFLNNKNPQAYQADVDISDNSDCEFYFVNNTIVGSEVGVGFYFQAAPNYLFNNFIYTTKQGLNAQLSVADGREPIIAVDNVIIGGEAAVNENMDDPMLSGNGNTLGVAADNSLASFGMSSNITREGNIGFLAISATSKLIDKGLADSSEYTETNVIPSTDCRGVANYGGKDIGAYEYSPAIGGGDNEGDGDDNNNDGENGIEGIKVDEYTSPVYFNLNGTKVVNPSNGVFIEKRGNQVRKVLVK